MQRINRSRVRGLVTLIVALLALTVTGGTIARGGAVAGRTAIPAGIPASANWMTYGGNLANQRYSSLARITTGNVATLKATWTFHTGTFGKSTSFESSPVVVDGVMYLTGPHSQVFALDARTGKSLWQYTPLYDDLNTLPLCCGQVNRGVAVGDGKVFVGQLDGKLTALNQRTGAVAWSIQVGDPRQGYSETAAPLYHDGRVYIGVAGGEYEVRGYVTAYAAATGHQLWRFYTIPAPGKFGHNTWPAEGNIWRRGGGGVWMTPALDPALGLLYILVGNPSPDLDGSVRAGDNLFTGSVVALDLKTGLRRWHFQALHHDIWDLDPSSPNLLFDTTIGGKRVRGLAEAGKTGWVYLLDRTTGRPLTPIVEKPVPQNTQQHTAATQPYVLGDAFVPQRCPQHIGVYPLGDLFTPVARGGAMQLCPSANGGSEWSPISYSPRTNNLYVCGIHEPQVFSSHPEKQKPGSLRLGSIWLRAPTGKTWGTLTAIDARTNRIAWQQRWSQMCIGGSLATAGGLVFAGEGNGNLDASDAKTGRRLWQFQTGAGVNAPPITYEVGGEQFVAVASGGNYQLDYPRGDTLWVFSLKGTMGPASAPPAPSNIGPSYPSGQGKTARVALTSDGFVPMRLPIAPGTTVTWTNDTSTVNTVTSETGAWDSGTLQPGQSFSYTFRKTGPYDYASTTHPGLGGVVVVWPTRRRQP
jgi:quinohemoprotein ethanol dehydrogenase